jgi:glycosyltransferase involved in cell wall biosynthesis
MAPEIFASEGGIPRILQTYLKALSETAASENGQVRLVALNDSVVPERELSPEIRATLGEVRVCGRSRPAFIRGTLALSRGVDHLICGHVAQLPVAWLAARLRPGLRYSLVAHGIEVWRPFSVFETRALRGAHRIFCVSDYTRRELLSHCALPPARAVVLPNALDPAFSIARGQPLPLCPPVILSVGRLNYDDRYKGFQNLIEAMPAIRAEMPDAILRIVGRGDDLPRLIKIRDGLGMTQAVEFLGYVSDDRLKEEFRTCRLFALPSRKEGFGLVYVEAMAHSRPCLAARAGGATEVVSPSPESWSNTATSPRSRKPPSTPSATPGTRKPC